MTLSSRGLADGREPDRVQIATWWLPPSLNPTRKFLMQRGQPITPSRAGGYWLLRSYFDRREYALKRVVPER